MTFPARAKICECFCRDGLQNRPEFVPTEKKIAMIDRCTQIGMPLIEVTSFAHPKYLPQFKDCREVLAGIQRKPGVQYIALIPNEKGLERCLQFCDEGVGPTAVTVIIAASEAYSQKNVRSSIAEALEGVRRIVPRAKEAGLYVIGSVSNSFGCHIQGDIPFEQTARLAKEYADLGADEIQFGDTTGQANPVQTAAFFTRMQKEVKGPKLIAHLHDTRGVAMANAVAALGVGIERFDCSLGGIGGRPAGIVEGSEMRHTGNLDTEDWVCLLAELGVDTGMSPEGIIGAANLASEILGEPLLGHVTETGPVRHAPAS